MNQIIRRIEVKEAIKKLVNVKSIVTIAMCAVFAYLAVAGRLSADQFINIFTVVIAFYFGTQSEKRRSE